MVGCVFWDEEAIYNMTGRSAYFGAFVLHKIRIQLTRRENDAVRSSIFGL